VLLNSPVRSISLNDDKTISHLTLDDGDAAFDEYVSAAPVDIFKKMVPAGWSTMPFFRQIDELEGIPVINIHLWFDKKLTSIDGLCFSRSPLLSVYADMSTCCREYASSEASMLELVFAPCSPKAGGNVNWIAKSDEKIVDATMGELKRLFPTEIASDEAWPSTLGEGKGTAKLTKHAVVRVPRSVYAAVPGRNRYRPSQKTPIPHFTLAGDWAAQKFLGSMEGAVLSGKLAAEVIVDADSTDHDSAPAQGIKPVEQHVISSCEGMAPKEAVGVRGNYPIAFGGGQQGSGEGTHV